MSMLYIYVSMLTFLDQMKIFLPARTYCLKRVVTTKDRKKEREREREGGREDQLPVRLPERAASMVETWNSRSASSTWLSRANGRRDIFASDSEILMMASSCLHSANSHMYMS